MTKVFKHCFPQWRPDFDPLPAYLRFVNKVALGQFSTRALRFPPVSAIPVFILTFILILSKGQADDAFDFSGKSNALPEILSAKNEIIFI
jgi:hypothetical protein